MKNTAEMEEVISVFRSKTLRLHTTRSWDFLGLTLSSSSSTSTAGTPLQLAYGEDIIVGIFDTGLLISLLDMTPHVVYL